MGIFPAIADTIFAAFDPLGVVESVVFRRATGGTRSAGGVETETFTDTTATLAFTAYSVEERRNAAILPEDFRTIAQASTLGSVPAVGDTIIRQYVAGTPEGGDFWSVVKVDPLPPGAPVATAAAYDLQVRRPS